MDGIRTSKPSKGRRSPSTRTIGGKPAVRWRSEPLNSTSCTSIWFTCSWLGSSSPPPKLAADVDGFGPYIAEIAPLMSERVAKQGLAFQPVTWLTIVRAASSRGLSVATRRQSPSNANPTTMCFLATSAGIAESTSGDTGVVVGSQKGRANWSATAATRSRSLTSPSVERIFARGTPVSVSLANAYSSASLERTLRFTRNSPTLREAVCITVLSASL